MSVLLAAKLLASGVSHGNIMPSVCQSRLSEERQEWWLMLSTIMASGLAASCSGSGV